jgi:putative transposase
MRWGFLYLVAVMDWATGNVLAGQLSNTMDVSSASNR